MSTKQKVSRLDYLYNLFEKRYRKNCAKGYYTAPENCKDGEVNDFYYDKYFIDFCVEYDLGDAKTMLAKNQIELLFNFFSDCDTSVNKEYLSWFINIYNNLIKSVKSTRFDVENRNVDINKLRALENEYKLFFEDLRFKVKPLINTFSFIKKTNIISNEQKDINIYPTINSFVSLLTKYTSNEDGEDDEVVTLNHKEIECIVNFNEKNKTEGFAELVFENDTWVIVVTHDFKANKVFGAYTNWCTRMDIKSFNSYNKKGELFVLIKKKFGSKKEIIKNPNVRLQFHFQSELYMDAKDAHISIKDFFNENVDIKKFFGKYILENVIPYLKKSYNFDEFNYLKNYNLVSPLIDLIIKTQSTHLNLSDMTLTSDEIKKIGSAKKLEILNLSNTNITNLFKPIQHLSNLKILDISNNKKLKTIPSWISKLTNLTDLNCSLCDITEISDLNHNTNLEILTMDDNKNLTELPNISSLAKLEMLTASNCNLNKINNDFKGCTSLFFLDLHSNKNLEELPNNISKLPNIKAINIDETKISKQKTIFMLEDSNNQVVIINYA